MDVFTMQGELRIAADAAGPEDGDLVVLLHGGGQTRHSWGRAVQVLAEAGFRAVAVDLRGHGDSDWAPDAAYDLSSYAEDLRHLLRTLRRPAALVGASLGGIAALLVAGEGAPVDIRALVLVDFVPHVEAEGAREIHDFMAASPLGFESVDEAAAVIAAYLPNRRRRPASDGLMKNLRLREDGRFHWHWDPAMLTAGERQDPTATKKRLEQAATNVGAPTLLIRGGRSRIVSMEGVAAFQRLMPDSEFVNIPAADHMVAGDANDAFNVPLVDFLRRHREMGPARSATGT